MNTQKTLKKAVEIGLIPDPNRIMAAGSIHHHIETGISTYQFSGEEYFTTDQENVKSKILNFLDNNGWEKTEWQPSFGDDKQWEKDNQRILITVTERDSWAPALVTITPMP